MSFDFEKNHPKEEDSLASLTKSLELKLHNLVLNDLRSTQRSLVRSAKPGRKVILNFKQVKGCESWVKKLFLTSSHGLPSMKVPRHLLSVDEKYLRLCLEAIHVTALKGASCGVSGNATGSHIGYPQGDRGSAEVLRSSVKFVVGYPIASTNNPSVIWNPVEQCVLGSITESNSMMSILNSPLFQRLGLLDDGKNPRPPMLDSKSFAGSVLTQAGGLSSTLAQTPGRGPFGHSYDGDRPDVAQGSPVSVRSAHSVSVDQPSNRQGMLRCRWIDGLPCFEFSVDDQKELYVANAFRAESANKALDYVYSFRLKADAGCDDFHDGTDIVGKMKVSTSFSLCPNSSKVAETEFILFGISEGQRGDEQTKPKTGKRSRRLSRVMEAFKSSQTSKLRTPTSFVDSIENTGGVTRVSGPKSKIDFARGEFPPELELAAIVVKHHIQGDSHEKEDTGGWGLKFLRKPGSTQSPDPSASRFEVCSMSADIILPADFHGRPTNEDSRPSSIIERWKSGGRCDCGGWDVGCPITVLESTPRIERGVTCSESPKDCKSFDIYLKGSREEGPVMKMANVHDGLYFVTFSSSLPILRCFSIAVALVHSQSPALRRKHVQV